MYIVLGGQNRMLDHLELFVIHLVSAWVLGTKLKFSTRAANMQNYGPISLNSTCPVYILLYEFR